MRDSEQELALLIRHINGLGPKPHAVPIGLVRYHRLGALAYRHGFLEFKQDFIQHALFAELREQSLTTLFRAFAKENIRICLLKGISYLATLYEDPAERSMGDVDLLVEEHKFHHAKILIEEHNYVSRKQNREQSRFHHALTFDQGKLTIDLHRRIYQPGRSRIDMAGVWARATEANERNDRVFRLSPRDELIFHLLHIARSELMVSAISYVDLPRLEMRSGLTRSRVLELAKTYRIERAIKAALTISDAIHEAPLHSLNTQHCRFYPSPTEVLGRKALSRRRQLVIKAQLTEGPRELLGLGLSTLLETCGIGKE